MGGSSTFVILGVPFSKLPANFVNNTLPSLDWGSALASPKPLQLYQFSHGYDEPLDASPWAINIAKDSIEDEENAHTIVGYLMTEIWRDSAITINDDFLKTLDEAKAHWRTDVLSEIEPSFIVIGGC